MFAWLAELQAKSYIIRVYNNNNGLPSASAGYVYQDSSGFIWQCCYGGMVRFDGNVFKTYDNSDGLANYDVKHLFEERKQHYWVCNNFNLVYFDGSKFKIQHTNLANDITYEKLIRLQNNQIWLLTNQGCFIKQNDSTYTRFKLGSVPSEKMYDFIELINGDRLNEFCYKLNRRYFGARLFNRLTLAMAKIY